VVEDHLIEEIIETYAPYYDTAEVVIDARGGFLLPGEAGAVELGAAVRMLTGAVADALPRLAPDRGYVRPGSVADLVITEPERLSAVREVLIAGRVVERGRGLW
jgi:alpha-D-ribose 1-methylphosphonate 5-triphosphate diphosphatase PhnM